MKKITLKDLTERLGNRETSQLIGVDTATVWRWIDKGRDVVIELEKGKPVAYTIRKEVRRED